MARECPNCSKEISFFRVNKFGARKTFSCPQCCIKLRSMFFWRIVISVFIVGSLAWISSILLFGPLLGDALGFLVFLSLWYYLWSHVDRLEIDQAEHN